MLRLIDLSKVKFQIDLPEKAMPMLKYVKEVIVTIQSFPGREFPAKVHEVANEASRTTRTYRVTLLLDQPEDVRILPGMTGDARAKTEAVSVEGGLEVLPSALFEGGDSKSYVWLVDEATRKVRRHEVTISRVAGNTVLVKGMTPGQTVVTAGVQFLREGQEVRLLDDEKTAPATNPKTAAAPAVAPEVGSAE